MENNTKAEHIEIVKDRAYHEFNFYKKESLDKAISNAVASVASDLTKHEETKNHCAAELGVMLLFSGHLNTERELVKFIEGIN